MKYSAEHRVWMSGTVFLWHSFAPKGEDLYHEEGDGNAEDGGNDVADDGREAQHIIEEQYDEVLDDVIRQIGDKEFYIPAAGQWCFEDDKAVHPIGDDIAYDIADIEIQVIIRTDKGA